MFPANLLKRDGKSLEIGNGEEAALVREHLESAAFQVEKVTARERRRNPVPPFITSKLQQESFRKLGFAVRKTMQVAQRLYEGVELGTEGAVGLITYMRTDSTRVSADALTAVRAHIAETYGEDYIPEKPNVYKAKKDAQDAHEAIRPTYFDHDPEKMKKHLGKDELRLYTLIWNRFVASQMRPAVYDETVVDIAATPKVEKGKAKRRPTSSAPRAPPSSSRGSWPSTKRRRKRRSSRSPPLPPKALPEPTTRPRTTPPPSSRPWPKAIPWPSRSSTPTSTSPSRPRVSARRAW